MSENKKQSKNRKIDKKRILTIFFSMILLVECFICQAPFVYASSVPEPDPVTVQSLFSVIEGANLGGASELDQIALGKWNLMTQFFADTGGLFALGTLAKENYNELLDNEIQAKIDNGTLTTDDIGYVWYKNGVPVAVVSGLYGHREYLITSELAAELQQQRLEDADEIESAIKDYWDRVYISDVQPFQELASNLNNWVVSFEDFTSSEAATLRDKVINLIRGRTDLENDMFNAYDWQAHPNTWGVAYNPSASASARSVTYSTECYYCIIYFTGNTYGYTTCRLMAIDKDDYEGHLYRDSNYNIIMTSAPGFRENVGPKNTYSLTPDLRKFNVIHTMTGIIANDNTPYTLPWSQVCTLLGLDPDTIYPPAFWENPLIVLNPGLNPLIQPGVRYNVGKIGNAVDGITDAADEAIANNPSPKNYPSIDVSQDPDIVGDLEPVGDPENSWNPSEWPSLEDNQIGGGGGGGDDPNDPDDPNNPNDPDDRHQLKIPELLGLFPFCIPFDIKNAITCLGIGEGWESPTPPVFDVPFNITYDGRQIVNYTFHLDLSDYSIWVALGYIRTVEVICYIIVLAMATSDVIF